MFPEGPYRQRTGIRLYKKTGFEAIKILDSKGEGDVEAYLMSIDMPNPILPLDVGGLLLKLFPEIGINLLPV